MALWIISIALLLIWAGGMLFHKGGFIHILLLCAIAIIVVQLVAMRKAT
ncbi:MAG TPA: lmo0937 family membrane protein [Pyrinomonadaceae bacterium]